MAAWFATPPGRYLLDWERARFAEAVADAFGFHALQLGLPQLDALAGNRMPHRWLALPEAPDPTSIAAAAAASARGVDLVTHAAALPFPAASLDLVLLPHTLELSADPHAVLREVERVLVPNGRVIISGLNPASWWGLRQYRAHALARLGLGGWTLARLYLPEAGAFIGAWRLRDWLRLLSFEVAQAQHGCYRLAVRSQRWLDRLAWMDRLGARWWPPLGAVYFIVAVKRVRGLHLLGPAWRPTRAAAAPAVVARRDRPSDGEATLP
ncbi:MAG: methyltransferase domain-containing protein [Pseudomonadota bacterium]|uniref:class I SAM-dependent methyltransferase n=1 Tax=Tepidimonas thermarum TaxID=335431 RepID=UPI00117FB4B5|nr:methyltransferase domain-containing protein [Tepidimonas thermarum]